LLAFLSSTLGLLLSTDRRSASHDLGGYLRDFSCIVTHADYRVGSQLRCVLKL